MAGEGYRILQGDCRAVLRTLPEGSVQCVVTSPPYYGLRDYGLPPSVWGGDEACEHEWHEDRYYTNQTAGESSEEAFTEPGAENVERVKKARWRENATCGKCGAWRGFLGLEKTPWAYVDHLVEVFRELRRVLRDDGVAWLNLGDSYTGGGGFDPDAPSTATSKSGKYGVKGALLTEGVRAPGVRGKEGLPPKNLIGVPWRVALALQEDGWWLRSDVIWAKLNCMPEAVTDRPTRSHEYVFLLAKQGRYFYDSLAVAEDSTGCGGGGFSKAVAEAQLGHGAMRLARPIDKGTRNRRTVWSINLQPFPGAHFATFPEKLVDPCVLAGTSERGCCAKCGEPWHRKTESMSVERVDYDGKWIGEDAQSSGRRVLSGARAMRAAGMPHDAPFPPRKTIGWELACSCGTDESVPCVVLDPFCGTGTVGVVARRHGREFIGIELNPEYAKMAEGRVSAEVERIGEAAPVSAQPGQQIGLLALDEEVEDA